MTGNLRDVRRTGWLVLVTGASGVGKDSILAGARALLSDDGRFVFPRRVVTREPNADEDNLTATPEQFIANCRNGSYALTWIAHDLSYAIPASIEDHRREGRVVVCNVSRSVVEDARRRLAPAICIEITAPADVLRVRLLARGRESGEAIERRLARQPAERNAYRPDIVIENAAALETAVADFVHALRALA